jgi:hypothetical protein
VDDPRPIPDERTVRELAQALGCSVAAARALLGAVLAEANPPPGMIVTV